ncbi:MAG: peptidase M16, partial [Propionibacteriaceae bacterium]|nr:peptidase M16 [Propionibacteriaceae bacterium]
EIDRLVAEGPTELELRRAKAQYERQWLHELARVDSRADALGEYATLQDDPGLINTRLAEIEAVDQAAAADAMRRWLRTDQRATLIYRQEQQ